MGGALRNASLLWLDPLPTADAGRLFDELLGTTMPTRLRDMVIARAEGNPFFVEELLGTLIDGGVLEARNGSWDVKELPEDFEIPDTVQAVVAARMDLLPPAEKTALQAASVCGRMFWAGPVAELLEGATPDFELLEDRDFIRRRSGSTFEGEHEYAIKHALTREIAYASVPKARRAHLYARFAAWLERTGGGRAEHVPLLAHHYAEAARPESADLAWSDDPATWEQLRAAAAVWLRRAAEAAVSRYDIDEAVELFERALEFAEDVNAQAAILREIGRANALGFRGQQFWEAMERSLELTSDPLVRGETFAELGFQTSFRGGMWNRAPDRVVVADWIAQGLELTDPKSAARAKTLCASVFWGGRLEQPHDRELELATEAVRLADELGDPDLLATAFLTKATSAYRAGRYEEALEWAQQPQGFVDSLTDPERVADLHEEVVPIALMLGRLDDARAAATAGARLMNPLSPHHRVHGVALAAEVEEAIADWDALCALTPLVEQRIEENSSTFCIRNPRTLLVCAAAHLRGRARRGGAVGGQGSRDEHGGLGAGAGRAAAALGAPPERPRQVRRILDGIDAGSAGLLPLVGLPAYLALRLDAFAALGDFDRVEEEVEGRVELTGALIEPFVLRALGQARSQRELVEQAAARFQAMGLDWHAEQTRQLL